MKLIVFLDFIYWEKWLKKKKKSVSDNKLLQKGKCFQIIFIGVSLSKQKLLFWNQIVRICRIFCLQGRCFH